MTNERQTVNAVLSYNDNKVDIVEWTARVLKLLESCQLLLGIVILLLLVEVVHPLVSQRKCPKCVQSFLPRGRIALSIMEWA